MQEQRCKLEVKTSLHEAIILSAIMYTAHLQGGPN